MLKNKTILITGGGSGIGESLTKLLSKTNKVIICGRNEDKLKKVATENDNVTYFVVDVTNPIEIDGLFEKFSAKGVVLDVLFNNAGVVELWEIKNTTLSSNQIFSKINTNFTGAVCMVQKFFSQANAGVENYIINITSEVAIMPIPLLPLYSASKSGLSVFTKALRLQLQNSKFKVVEILPPAVETKMTTQDLNNTSKLENPDVFAENVIKNINNGKLEYAPGSNAFQLSLIRRFFPKAGLKLIDKLSRKQLIVK